MIYDNQGDCSVRYSIKLTQTINIKNSDAFSTEVSSVSLFVFDKQGRLVTTKESSIAELAANDNHIVLEIKPGTYDLIAWARGDVATPNAANFSYAAAKPVSKADLCRILETEIKDGRDYSNKNINRLYHAMADNIVFPDGYGTVSVDGLDFTKDTNTVTVLLQHYNKQSIKADDFIFTITDANGKLSYDNSVMAGPAIIYGAWNKFAANTDFEFENTPASKAAITSVSSVVAQLSLSRITMETNPVLTITKKDGTLVLRLPIVQLALLVKGEYALPMTNQEYLDRQDNYQLSFLLDDNHTWYASLGIIINGWHRIIQNSDI